MMIEMVMVLVVITGMVDGFDALGGARCLGCNYAFALLNPKP